MLTPPRVRVPEPDMVRPPLPEMMPLMIAAALLEIVSRKEAVLTLELTVSAAPLATVQVCAAPRVTVRILNVRVPVWMFRPKPLVRVMVLAVFVMVTLLAAPLSRMPAVFLLLLKLTVVVTLVNWLVLAGA